ncbi:MAG TPA: tetratricopeptide repeat protein [Methylibium sp.]
MIALGLVGCSAPQPQTWRVAPTYRVSVTGSASALDYAALARQYEGEQRWGDALNAWSKAASVAPDNAEVLDKLGVALAERGRYDEAVTALRRATELAPTQARPLNNLGYTLLLAGRTEEARTVLRKAVALDSHYELAGANLQRVDPDGPSARDAAGAPMEATAAAGETESSPASSTKDQRIENLAQSKPIIQLETAAKATALPLQTEPNAPRLALHSEETGQQPPTRQTAAADPPAASSTALEQEVNGASHPFDGLRIEIANGNGVTGMAARLGSWLRHGGLGMRPRLTNLRPFNTPRTTIYYRSGYAEAAYRLARRMPHEVEVKPQLTSASQVDLRVVLGHDLRQVAACPSDCATLSVTWLETEQSEAR